MALDWCELAGSTLPTVDFEWARLRRPGILLPLVLAGMALASVCVCCVGGLAGTLSRDFAVALLIATTTFTVAALCVGLWSARRPFRKVAAVVTGYLDAVRANDTQSAERWLTNHARLVKQPGELAVLRERAPANLAAFRIQNIHISDDGFGGPVAEVATTLAFDDGSNDILRLRLFPVGDDWKIEFYPTGY